MDVLLCDIYSNSHKYGSWNRSNFAGWGMPQGTGSTIITCNNVNASASNSIVYLYKKGKLVFYKWLWWLFGLVGNTSRHRHFYFSIKEH